MLANEFQEAVSTGRGRESVAPVFDRLLDYSVEHFKSEEGLMHRHQYPRTDRQVQEHRTFTAEVMALNKNKRYVFPESVVDFLNSWLRTHIMGIDKELGRFLSERGVT
jgi:hemerythrin-like metal-binding protein